MLCVGVHDLEVGNSRGDLVIPRRGLMIRRVIKHLKESHDIVNSSIPDTMQCDKHVYTRVFNILNNIVLYIS